MFHPYDIWKHKSCLDLGLLIRHIQFRGKTYYKVRVWFVNYRTGNLYYPEPKTVKIYKKDFPLWDLVQNKE